MIEVKELKKVLKDTKRIIKHHEELTVAKGDHFNLFSVLKIETRENNTHSAFLTELLNPKGAHRMGDVFLKLFLSSINHSDNFATERASAKMEVSVGTINLCTAPHEKKCDATGGRIDIYLKDKNGKVISIENKIHAIDQPAQIQRYCNHEKDKNTVYYLTLNGGDPCDDSKLNLKAGTDFYNISYKNDIITWLELCLKEVPNFTALREAINQYILLIKKLTNTLDQKHKEELTKSMLDYLLESQFIANNFQEVLNSIRYNFRKAIEKSLLKALDKETYVVTEGAPIHKAYAQLWIDIKGHKNPRFRFGIETFSGIEINHGNLFIGILDEKRKGGEFANSGSFNLLNEAWPHHLYILNNKGEPFNLREMEMLELIKNKESDSFKELVSTCSEQIVMFVNENTEHIKNHLITTK